MNRGCYITSLIPHLDFLPSSRQQDGYKFLINEELSIVCGPAYERSDT